MTNLKELHAYYLAVHDKIRDIHDSGCKGSCGTIECSYLIQRDYSTEEKHKGTWHITAGTYCIGPGRWEVIGTGKSLQEAYNKAWKYLEEL